MLEKIFKKLKYSAKIHTLQDSGVHFVDLDLVAISDLQLGHEAVLHNRGIDLPVKQLPMILERIDRMLKFTGAKRLLINGDIKHEFSKPLQIEWDDVIALFDFLKKRNVEIILVRGNHDNYVRKILRNQSLKLHDFYYENGVLFVHGHKKLEDYGEFPEFKKFKTLVIGHVHPAVSLRDEIGVPHKYSCTLKGEFQGKELIVLPSISPLAGGSDVVTGRSEVDMLSPILQECDVKEFVPVVIDEEAGVKTFPKVKYL